MSDELEAGPLPPDKKLTGPKEAAGLYDPGPGAPQTDEYGQSMQEHEASMEELRKSVYGTIGVNINGQEMEVPLWHENMTPAEAEDAARDRLEMGLHPFTPEDQLKKAQDDEQGGIRPGYEDGTNKITAASRATGFDDRGDLSRDAENAFYGGGTAPIPTPTPTPAPQSTVDHSTLIFNPNAPEPQNPNAFALFGDSLNKQKPLFSPTSNYYG